MKVYEIITDTIIKKLEEGTTSTDVAHLEMCKRLDNMQQCVVTLGGHLVQLHKDFAELKVVADNDYS